MTDLSVYERANLSSFERQVLSYLQGEGTGGVGGDASASNQDEQTAVLEELRDRLPFTGAASEATLAALINNLISEDFATATKQDAVIAVLNQIASEATLDTLVSNLLNEDFATAAKQDTQITALNQIRDRTSLYERVQNAADLVKTFNYTDAGTADERVSTIISTSAALSASFTDTYSYAGSAGAYRVTGVTRSQS